MVAADSVGRPEHRVWAKLLELAIPAAFALNTVFPVGNLDIWFHLKTGELIFTTWRIPTTDPFSYTAFGNPWINHEWLFALGAYLLHAAAGLTGLILVKAAIAGGVLWLVQRTIRRYGPSALLEVEVLILAALAIYPRIYVRPHLLSFLFMAYLVWRLDAFRQRASRSLWEIPALFALWSNIHGGVIFGLGVLGLTAFGEALDFVGRPKTRRSSRGSRRERLSHLVLVVILSALATLVNPFTYHLHIFIVEHLFIGGVVKIAEHVSAFGLGFTVYWVVAGVSAFALILLWPKRQWADILLVLAFGLFTMKSHRTAPLFAIVAAPVITKGLMGEKHGLEVAPPGVGPYLVASAALLAVAIGGQIVPNYYQRSGVPPVGLGLYEPRYPIGAATFVERHELPGPLYNEYDYGGYLIWRWYPARRVFQDGRTLVYDRKFFRAVYGAKTSSEWKELMDTYGVRLALVSSQVETNFTLKFGEDRWELLYWDEVAAVMIKRSPESKVWVDRYGYRLLRPFLSGSQVMTIVEKGMGGELEKEIQRHLAESPKSYRGKALLGWQRLAVGKPAEALEAFEEALDLNPYLLQAHWGAAKTYEALGQSEASRRHWNRYLRLEAKSSTAGKTRIGTNW